MGLCQSAGGASRISAQSVHRLPLPADSDLGISSLRWCRYFICRTSWAGCRRSICAKSHYFPEDAHRAFFDCFAIRAPDGKQVITDLQTIDSLYADPES